MNLKNNYYYPNIIIVPILTYSKIINILNIDNILNINFLLSVLIKYEFNYPINPNISDLLIEIFYNEYLRLTNKKNSTEEHIEDLIYKISIELYNSIHFFIPEFDNEIYTSIYEVNHSGKNIIFSKK